MDKPKTQLFTMQLTAEERQMLQDIAAREQRTAAGQIRYWLHREWSARKEEDEV